MMLAVLVLRNLNFVSYHVIHYISMLNSNPVHHWVLREFEYEELGIKIQT